MDLTRKHGHNGSIARGFSRKIRAALALFAEAHDYAKDTKLTVWEYAVEADILLAVGLTPNDIRWFLHRGWVEHRRETTKPGADRRSFRRCRGRTLDSRSCFVLTDAGLALAGRVIGSSGTLAAGANPRIVRQDPGHGLFPRPRWDSRLHELSLGGQLIKRLRSAAPNQRIIFAAFEEEGWPPRIDDPLSKAPEQSQAPNRRLNDTIRNLNRRHAVHLVRFSGDGNGKGARWELVDDRLVD